MLNIIFYLHLIVLAIFAAFVGLYVNTTVQLLLVVVVIVFIIGLCLISLGSSILGSFIIIIYIGAIVILFAFCILFINNREARKEIKESPLSKLIMLIFIFITWEAICGTILGILSKSSTKSFLYVLTEKNYMLELANSLYGELFIPLILMISVLLLGLILVIKIIKKE